MAERVRSWLFQDKADLPPVWKEGSNKKVRYFVELRQREFEFRPVEAYKLWVIRRTYSSQFPPVPIVELELEGVDAVQRTPDPQDQDYIAKVTGILAEMDRQIIIELLQGIVVPEDDAWAADWLALGRPLPDASTLQNRSLRRDIYLAQCGLSAEERHILVRMIQVVSEETPEAIELAQELFRDYLDGQTPEGSTPAGRVDPDEPAGRDRDGDAGVAADAQAVVQGPAGGPHSDAGEQPQLGDEGVRQQPTRRRAEKS